MARQSEEAPGMVRFLNSISKELFGRDRTKSIESDICVSCGGEAIEFDDELSRQEFTISGFCQRCQDAAFCMRDEED